MSKIVKGDDGVFENEPEPQGDAQERLAQEQLDRLKKEAEFQPTFGATPVAQPAPAALTGRKDYDVLARWSRAVVGWEVRLDILCREGVIETLEPRLNGALMTFDRNVIGSSGASLSFHQAGQFPGHNQLEVTLNGLRWGWAWD